MSRVLLSIAMLMAFQVKALNVPRLLKDIQTGNKGSQIKELCVAGSLVYFVADDELHGKELWKSDGTHAGTMLVKDLCDGNCSSTPRQLTAVGSIVYFTAYESNKGTELWRSDGTVEGTYRVKDINNGASNYSPRSLTAFKGILYFSANDGKNGVELWRSDGTEKGTVMVSDFVEGAGSSYPAELKVFQSTLYYIAGEPRKGFQLMKLSKEGAPSVVQSFGPSADGSAPFDACVTDQYLYFQYAGSTSGNELWQFDGQAIKLVKDLNPGKKNGVSGSLSVFKNNIIFVGDNGSNGKEMYISNGTAAGTVMLKDAVSDVAGIAPYALAKASTYFLFCTYDKKLGQEKLWRSDGTEKGTVVIKTVTSTPGNLISAHIAIKDQLYFSRAESSTGNELWQSDGTEKGTVLLKDIFEGQASSDPAVFTIFGQQLLLIADNGKDGFELWKLKQGTTPEMVRNINTKGLSSTPSHLCGAQSLIYFARETELDGIELWASDGKEAGTKLVKHLYAGMENISFEQSCARGDDLFFICHDGKGGSDLWLSKAGAKPSTVLLKHFTEDNNHSIAQQMILVNGLILFNATGDKGDNELWKTDGTEKGTVLLKDINAKSSSYPQHFTSAGTYMFFTADNYNEGLELWRSDGTATGTTMVRDIYDGANSSEPGSLVWHNNALYFTASDELHGDEIWRSDGTKVGTVMIADVRKGEEGSSAEELAFLGDILFFSANNGKQGFELWKSDGTEKGTVMVMDIFPGAEDGAPSGFALGDNCLLFSATQQKTGLELWRTDGSTKGTELVMDIKKGVVGSNIRELKSVNNIVYFVALSGENNPEIWRSNGKGSSTQVVNALYSETNTMPPMSLYVWKNALYYVVDDATHGAELWVID